MPPDTETATPPPQTARTLDAHLDAVHAALRSHHAAYVEGLQTDGIDPLQNALDDIVEAHREAREALISSELSERHELWQAVRRYRQGTIETVWTPLREQVEMLELGRVLSGRRTALREAHEELAAELPDRITRPEPETLFAPRASDAWSRRMVKALSRGWRSLTRLLGDERQREQTVPLSSLVDHLAGRVLPKMEATALDAAEQHIVRWLARVEREATAWTHRLLDIERLLDRPEFHAERVDARLPEPAPDPTTGVADAGIGALRKEVWDRANALRDTLEAGRALDLDDVEEALNRAAAEADTWLRDASDRAGTLMAVSAAQSSSGRVHPAENRARKRQERWPTWVDEVAERLDFLTSLAALRDALIERHASIAKELVGATVEPARSLLSDAANRLAAHRENIDDLLDPADSSDELDLIQRFDYQVTSAMDLVEQELLDELRALTPRRSGQDVLDAHRAALASLVDSQSPGFVVHTPPPPDDGPIRPVDDAYSVPWQATCRDVIDELLFDTWEAAVVRVSSALQASTERATEARGIARFNLEAALQDLQDLRAARKQDLPNAPSISDARELADGGMDRVLDLLRAEDEALDEAAGALLSEIWSVMTETWTDVHDRARSIGETRAHVLRLRGELVRGMRWLGEGVGTQVRAATAQVQRTIHRTRLQVQRLVRLGHAAVGTDTLDEHALQETVDVLSTVDAVLADLPLVYRRLFSFRPVHDPDLLVGRDTDRAVIERHVNRWRRGLSDPLVLTGSPGSGRTSLLNVLRTTVFRDAQRHTLDLTERVTDEADFARQVVEALGVPVDTGPDLSLKALAQYLADQPVPDRLRVCFVEQFEHAFTRTVGGTDLAARILDFLSETDTRVLWIATATDAAWQILEATESAAAGLVKRHALHEFDRKEMEELVLRRHRRSGLRLTFAHPDDTTHPILARRLRSIGDESRQQEVLQTEFFDRLYAACGQNVTLALFYWFRSVSLVPDTATLEVQPLDPVSFGTLDALPLPHAFALKAFLEHGTLTVDEGAEILGTDRERSRALFETLGNALIIAPADRVEGPGVFQFTSVDYETRYRIRPLLVFPVTKFLRSRNIVH